MGWESPALSLGRVKRVRGYEIKQLPLGAYLKAAARLEGLPDEVARAVLPMFAQGGAAGGGLIDGVLERLKGIDADGLAGIIARLLSAAPALLIGLMSDLSGIPEAELTDNPNIGIAGFAEVVEAVIEVNQTGEALATSRRVAKLIKGMITNAGSKR